MSKEAKVPATRLSRMARMGGLAAGLAGNMALTGAGQLASGKRPQARDLFMTPANATRLRNQLSQMRGAAMKVGQMLSMEASDLMPPEFGEIIAALRSDAHIMPGPQLKAQLTASLGAGFMQHFKRFDVHPIAAASIGQVHRATLKDGREVALKVQYPGVRDSIDSDIRNLGTLIKLSGMLPRGVDLSDLLEEARLQLHEEADYTREADYLQRYRAALSDDTRFAVPELIEELSGTDLLAMEFMPGGPIEELEQADQETRDRVATELIALTLRELFEFELMQTDPNFANYRYNKGSGRLILLDFGATRVFAPEMAPQYRALLDAGLRADRAASRTAMLDIGLYDAGIPDAVETVLLDLFAMAMEPLRNEAMYDFGDTDLLGDLRAAGMDMAEDRAYVPLPPIDSLFLQRKIGGMYLLATRLRARVNMRALLEPYASSSETSRPARAL
ncbi:MAG: AarF/ABC1/UbiB kinase family protein [Litoreibacter sp.]|nr:AarF/ABC1/UbiB kinase family protein [Litoreibacter sp.]